jgi:hypothetical protein
VFLLRMMRKVFWGPLNPSLAKWPDLSRGERWLFGIADAADRGIRRVPAGAAAFRQSRHRANFLIFSARSHDSRLDIISAFAGALSRCSCCRAHAGHGSRVIALAASLVGALAAGFSCLAQTPKPGARGVEFDQRMDSPYSASASISRPTDLADASAANRHGGHRRGACSHGMSKNARGRFSRSS